MSTWTRCPVFQTRVQTAYPHRRLRASWGERRLMRLSTRIRQVKTCFLPREDRSKVSWTTSVSLTILLPTSLHLPQSLQASTLARLRCRLSTLILSRRTLSPRTYCDNRLHIRAPQKRSRCTFVRRLAIGSISQSRPITPSSIRTITTIGRQMMTSPRVIRNNRHASQCTGKQSRAAPARSVLALTLYLSYLVCSCTLLWDCLL